MAHIMMRSLISTARVVSCLRARNVRHVIDELAQLAAADAFLDHGVVCHAVLERRESSSFGFGRGVAVPHAAIPGLVQPIGVFARLKPAQDFGAADELPADLVFLLLSPGEDDPTHLRALACVVRRLRDRDVAACLRSVENAEALHIVLTSDAWRGTEESNRRPGEATAVVPGRDLTNAKMCTSIRTLC